MSATREGNRKAAATRLANDPEAFSKMGKKGGKKKNPKKGWGTNRKLASHFGKINKRG